MDEKQPQRTMPVINIEQYGGKQVAIVDGQIVASGHTWHSVLTKARKQLPRKPLQEILALAVPKSLDTTYHA